MISPDERFIMTSTSVGKTEAEDTSHLIIYDANDLKEFSRITVNE